MGSPRVWTAANVITALRNTIGDPSGATNTRWTAAELDDYYNRAQLQVVLDTQTVLETVWETSLVQSQREYRLPTNFLKDKSVQYVKTADTDIQELEYITWEQYQSWYGRDEDSEDEPQFYYLWRKEGDDPVTTQPGSIFLHPTPNSVAAGTNNLRIYGYKHPDVIDSTNSGTLVVELEAPHVEAAIMYAASLVHLDDGEIGAAQVLEGKYERQVKKIMGSLAEKTRSEKSRLDPRESVLLPPSARRRDLPAWRLG